MAMEILSGLSPLTLACAALWTLSAGAYLLFALHRSVFGCKAGKLPPGPWFHFPLLGDSIHLAAGNPFIFFFKRFKRYGRVYRSMMLGSRLWVIGDMAALRAPLNDEGAVMHVPFRSFKILMGEDDFISNPHVHGPWRKLFAAGLAPPHLAALVPHIEAVMRSHVTACERTGRINIFREARLLGVDLAVDVITQVPMPLHVDRTWFKSQLEIFLDGLYGLPLLLPGGCSSLSRALAARDRLTEVLMPAVAAMHDKFTKEWDAAKRDIQSYSSRVLEQQHENQELQQQQQQHCATDADSVDNSINTRPTANAEESVTQLRAASSCAAASSSPSPSLPPSSSSASILNAQWMGWAAIDRGDLRQAVHALLHTLVAAGDTTRFMLFNTWSLLAMSQRVQDNLFAEQLMVVAKHGPELSHQALCSMPYMDATMKECMRLLPAAFGGFRKLTADLRVDEYIIPKGETIWYNTGLLHCLDPVLWDGDTSYNLPPHMDWQRNLEAAFRPERWMVGGGGGGEDARPRTLATFGYGAHLCLGMNLVYLEVKLLLAMILRKYHLRLETPDMLLRCKRLFPFFVPDKGTDAMLLVARDHPVRLAAGPGNVLCGGGVIEAGS